MVTLEFAKEDAMNLPLTQPTGNAALAAGPARFTFASGARPLEGYTIKRGIGHGGFGEVYYAVSDGGKEVALKLVRRNLDIELRGVMQCLNLKHPNLVSLFDIRQDGQEETWVVMEYVSGQSLQDVLANNPNGMPMTQVLHWMHGMCAGVAYLHDHGIVHRDIKPGNVFLEDSIVKIGDYGLSKFISCSRRSGHTGSVGTVHYMAPEVANGRYGKEVDIYALGVVLYEMITGHVPFDGESLGEVLMKHLTAQPDLSMIAEPYRTAIARALAKDPEQRVRSVAELAALLPQSPSVGQNTAATAQTMHYNGGRAADPRAASSPASVPFGVPFNAGDQHRPLPNAGHPLPVLEEANRPSGNREPLWQLIRATGLDIRRWWDQANLANWQRLMIVLFSLVGGAMIFGAGWFLWLPAAVFYGIWWVIWSLAFKAPKSAANNAPRAGAAPPVGGAAGPAAGAKGPGGPPPSMYRRWRGPGPVVLPPLTARQRMAELVGSMVVSGFVTLLVALVMILVRGAMTGTSPIEPNQYAWLAISAIVASWGVLIPAKLWQGNAEDATLRRFTMLSIGLAIGAAVYAISRLLLVSLPYETFPFHEHPFTRSWHGFYNDYGAPTIYAFLAYFGIVFFIPRWWRLADPLRRSRLTIWATAFDIGAAGIANLVLPFPQPWGFLLVATISIAVQMSSTWIPWANRTRAVQ